MSDPCENEGRATTSHLAKLSMKATTPAEAGSREAKPRATLPKPVLGDITNTNSNTRQTIKPNYGLVGMQVQNPWEKRALEKTPSETSHLDSIDMMNSELKRILREERGREEEAVERGPSGGNVNQRERVSSHDHTFHEICERVNNVASSPQTEIHNRKTSELKNRSEIEEEERILSYFKKLEAESENPHTQTQASFEAKVMVVDYSQKQETRKQKETPKNKSFNEDQFSRLMMQVDKALETKESLSTFQSVGTQSKYLSNQSETDNTKPCHHDRNQQSKSPSVQHNNASLSKQNQFSVKSDYPTHQQLERKTPREEFSNSRDDGSFHNQIQQPPIVKNHSIHDIPRKPKLDPESVMVENRPSPKPHSISLQVPAQGGPTGRFNVQGKSVIVSREPKEISHHNPSPSPQKPRKGSIKTHSKSPSRDRSISKSSTHQEKAHLEHQRKKSGSAIDSSDQKNLTFEEQEELNTHLIDMKLAELRSKLTFLMMKKPKDCVLFLNLLKQILVDFVNDRVYDSCNRNFQDICSKVEILLRKAKEISKVVKNNELRADEKFQGLMTENISGDVHSLIKLLGNFSSNYSSLKDPASNYETGQSQVQTSSRNQQTNKEMEGMLRRSEELAKRRDEHKQNNYKVDQGSGHTQPAKQLYPMAQSYDKLQPQAQHGHKGTTTDNNSHHRLQVPEGFQSRSPQQQFVSRHPSKPSILPQYQSTGAVPSQGLYRSLDQNRAHGGRVVLHNMGTQPPGGSINRYAGNTGGYHHVEDQTAFHSAQNQHYNQHAEANFLLSQKFGCKVFCIKMVQKSLVCGFEDGGLSVFAISKSEGLNLERSNKLHARSISSLTCTPTHHKKLLLFTGYAGSSEASIVVWDFLTLKPLKELCGHSATISSLEYAMPNYLISCSFDRKVIFWDLNECEAVLCTEVHNAPILSSYYDSESKILHTGSLDSTIVSAGLVFEEGELIDCRILKTISGTGPVLMLTAYLGDKLLSFQSSKLVIYDSRGMLFREIKTNTLPNSLEMLNEDQGLFVDVHGRPHWLDLGEHINSRRPIEFAQNDRSSMEKSSILMGMRLNGAYARAQFLPESNGTLVLSLNEKNDTVFFFKIK